MSNVSRETTAATIYRLASGVVEPPHGGGVQRLLERVAAQESPGPLSALLIERGAEFVLEEVRAQAAVAKAIAIGSADVVRSLEKRGASAP